MASEESGLKSRIRRLNQRLDYLINERIRLRNQATELRIELFEGIKDLTPAFDSFPCCKEFMSRCALLETIIAEEVIKMKRVISDRWVIIQRVNHRNIELEKQKIANLNRHEQEIRSEIKSTESIYLSLLKDAIREAENSNFERIFEKLCVISREIEAISREIKELRLKKIDWRQRTAALTKPTLKAWVFI